MRLYVIGSSARAQIVFTSKYVSGYHAELLQLDNGDMLLTDKGSSNGTYVNGVKIAPEQDVRVTRNDHIRFADQDMNWSLVPVNEMPKNVKVLKSIGSHALNTCQIYGNQVSRFHATVKQKTDGKWYICDHSSNGTTVNGARIPKDQDVRLKRSDSIACAGVNVQNPIPGSSRKTLFAVLGGAAVVAVIVGAVIAFMGYSDKMLYEKYSNATAMVIASFHYKVSTPHEVVEWVVDPSTDVVTVYDGTNSIAYAATGFFISSDGVFVSNLHVAKPWLYGDEAEITQIIAKSYQRMHQSNGQIVALADIKVEGVLDFIGVIPNGQFFDDTNLTKGREVISSDSKDVDIAIFQTLNNKLPEGATYIPISKIDDGNRNVGSHVYTMGFPLIGALQDLNGLKTALNRTLQAVGAGGQINQNNEKCQYGLNAISDHGASGSPVFDSKGRMVGISHGGYAGTQGYNFAIKSKYIHRLLKKVREEE